MDRSTIQVQDGLCEIIKDLYTVIRKVILMTMWARSTCGDSVIAQYISGGAAASHMGILREDVIQ